VEFTVIADKSDYPADKQTATSDTQYGSDAEPENVPDASCDKEKAVAFDSVKDFFICCIHVHLQCFVLRPKRGQNMKMGLRAFSPHTCCQAAS